MTHSQTPSLPLAVTLSYSSPAPLCDTYFLNSPPPPPPPSSAIKYILIKMLKYVQQSTYFWHITLQCCHRYFSFKTNKQINKKIRLFWRQTSDTESKGKRLPTFRVLQEIKFKHCLPLVITNFLFFSLSLSKSSSAFLN